MNFSNFEYKINNNIVSIPSWDIENSQNWAVIGNNGSGKSLLGEVLQNYDNTKTVGYISFEVIETLLEEERLKDDTDFLDKEDPGTLVKEYLNNLNSFFNLEDLKNRGLKYLSTGELVKVLILKELEKKPDILILDEPFDGLDIESQKTLTELIGKLIDSPVTLILILNREEDIHKNISHIAFIHENRIILTGSKDEILSSESFKNIRHFSGNIPETLPGIENITKINEQLITLNSVSISFADTKVLKDITWSVKSGEHYKIIGPNGSGKSTLLKIISADNHQSYGQDITLFGMKRGTGESIWDIKQHIGLVSSGLQKDYRVSVSLLSVVISGFYDSIGLYNDPTPKEISEATQWLSLIGMSSKKHRSFKTLSYGEQRLVLIVRAMVKHPKVLILDEPCLGLDQVNRELILMLIDNIALKAETTLLYVSHRKEDYIPSINRELHLIPTVNGSIGDIK
ncbi:MAG: ATP-binding cassette domain-containing protein [Spirochaetaceae bacterium]